MSDFANLPKPGDKDFVAGQPTTAEELKKTEDEAAAKEAAAKDAAAKAKSEADARAKAATEHQGAAQHPPGKK